MNCSRFKRFKFRTFRLGTEYRCVLGSPTNVLFLQSLSKSAPSLAEAGFNVTCTGFHYRKFQKNRIRKSNWNSTGHKQHNHEWRFHGFEEVCDSPCGTPQGPRWLINKIWQMMTASMLPNELKIKIYSYLTPMNLDFSCFQRKITRGKKKNTKFQIWFFQISIYLL